MKPSITLIINTYNQPEYLARVLRAVSGQREAPDEVILADDGSGEETRQVFGGWAAAQRFGARHVWQEKDGFRRSRILNACIAQARADYLIFLDGDTVPHPWFVSDHRSHARRGCYLQGHRVLVTERASIAFGKGNFSTDRQKAFLAGDLLGIKHIFRWPIALRRVKPNYDGVRGCNLSAWRKDLTEVNGYSEDYVGWGCEDLDLALRLIHSGVKRLDVRGQALCYHLWHPKLDRSNLQANEKLLFETAARKRMTCERGLNLHLEKPLCTVWGSQSPGAPQANGAAMAPCRGMESMQPSR